MAFGWAEVRSLLLVFGPILLPKAISAYKSIRNASRYSGEPVPPPAGVARALAVLAGVVIVYLIKSMPPLAPENVFALTQSRLQIPVDVLFTRLASLRPDGLLSAADERLRARFVNLESRLLYLQLGPDALADCPFCKSDDPKSFFYYALPAIILPHILNLVVLAAVTSPALTGRDAARWRPHATIAAAALAVADASLVNAYDYSANSAALRLQDLDFFYWKARALRLVGLAVLDAGVGALLFLSGTRRAFVQPPSDAERIEASNRALAMVRNKLNALGIVKNTALRDEELRARSQAYWLREGQVMRETMEEREVVESINNALEGRIDMRRITAEADTYAESIFKQPDEVAQL
ncbi:hypothetical protein CH63R_12926 [Colletotrichum higginsianum IMI 349063]|uniref:Chorismate synthase protein n=2 Tax=Colletotrichum higginsianum TaxID=80884 RepID=A0A1B7XVJ0_COLHI|nr:hypothetical protein CH63R_12926 [Colletotrichum higginsianum IMI 349063]OBR03799.1 hypothetical protein CH63R_12926 [Colletotrichum higginsianum IMI 349063]TIC97456.1 hypothetical protein CH35J_006887 [Colletotrichum higginsianum]GJD01868.1 hypothetical protein ColKHC_10693 [Colletotrichum higginsianum]